MAPSKSSLHHDVVIVGAGHNGIVAAKTYLQINPSVDILIIDGGSSIGGVWSAERIYPGLIYEMPCPMANFTDFDMEKELGVEPWGDVTGYQINEFLNRYAQKYDIPKLCQFNTQAVAVERNESGWKVVTRRTVSSREIVEEITCTKLIISTGITSKPKPTPWDLSKFEGISFHAVEVGQRQHEVLAPEIKHVTVVGGHKSALEAVGAFAQAGKKVEWLIRKEGGGPTWMMPARNPDGSSLAKLSTKRFMGFLSSSVYHSDRWVNRFFHSGKYWFGTWFLNWFWRFMTTQVKKDAITKKNRYHRSENGRKLEPVPETLFWFVPGGTMLHGRDLETFKLVDEGHLVNVTRENMISAVGKSITLSNGDKLSTDAIIYCTGWELAFPPLFSPDLANELGIPVDPSILSPKQKAYWKTLDALAEARIDNDNPLLKNPPRNIHIPKSAKTPFRLFRSIVPPTLAARGDNSLVILGNYAGGRVQQTSEINCLWAIAYLEDLMPPAAKAILANEELMNKDIAHLEAFRRKRYLNSYPYRLAIFEAPEYEDLVLTELGLRSDRKRMRVPGGWRGWFGWKAWVEEWFGCYLAGDYEGIVREFLESVGERRGCDESTSLDF
ncbi:hypothetical protein BKA61DRAFT_88352 [Leptodontidium sp. MPI-SDFR-AT-0119]|nr:hypothetical protein BKA61DRAFT_88352 [Leptodontidium sp. MPI-SDFR-AT-0119]